MLRIKQATLSDIASLQGIRRSIADDLPLQQRDRSDSWFIDNLDKSGRGWICFVDGQAVGFVIANLGCCSINSLYVKPEWQRSGIGQALLRKACGYLFRQGAKQIHLETEKTSNAYFFYLNRGWRAKHSGENGPTMMTLDQMQKRSSGLRS